jgi:hypothetical protein
MNKEELRSILRRESIREEAYDLDGGHLVERLTLSHEGNKWFIYYSERGLESGKREFATESAACECLLTMLRADPTARLHNQGGKLP